ncbi:MAG: hypothetical protein Q9220_000803 [cf. Caloplaca sp. 1 TL-2023]
MDESSAEKSAATPDGAVPKYSDYDYWKYLKKISPEILEAQYIEREVTLLTKKPAAGSGPLRNCELPQGVNMSSHGEEGEAYGKTARIIDVLSNGNLQHFDVGLGIKRSHASKLEKGLTSYSPDIRTRIVILPIGMKRSLERAIEVIGTTFDVEPVFFYKAIIGYMNALDEKSKAPLIPPQILTGGGHPSLYNDQLSSSRRPLEATEFYLQLLVRLDPGWRKAANSTPTLFICPLIQQAATNRLQMICWGVEQEFRVWKKEAFSQTVNQQAPYGLLSALTTHMEKAETCLEDFSSFLDLTHDQANPISTMSPVVTIVNELRLVIRRAHRLEQQLKDSLQLQVGQWSLQESKRSIEDGKRLKTRKRVQSKFCFSLNQRAAS